MIATNPQVGTGYWDGSGATATWDPTGTSSWITIGGTAANTDLPLRATMKAEDWRALVYCWNKAEFWEFIWMLYWAPVELHIVDDLVIARQLGLPLLLRAALTYRQKRRNRLTR